MRKQRPSKWTDAAIEQELRNIAGSLGWFPSVSELTGLGRNDIACIMSKRGGMLAWSDRIGIPRRHSDSDTGWDGELAVQKLLVGAGYKCDRATGIKNPFDLMVNDVLRVDVKAARLATYLSKGNRSEGWYYRIGKVVQSDIVVFYQLDTTDFYAMPWWSIPSSNITFSHGGGIRSLYRNNWSIIEQMIETRTAERLRILRSVPLQVA